VYSVPSLLRFTLPFSPSTSFLCFLFFSCPFVITNFTFFWLIIVTKTKGTTSA
jgi:hypothetical protein